MEYVIGERELDPVLALTHRTAVTMTTIAEGVGGAFRTLAEHAAARGIQWAGPPFVIYPEDCDGEFEITVCMPVAPGAQTGEYAGAEEIPGGRCVTTTHVGPYSEIGNAYEALQKWMADNGRRSRGTMREVYLSDPAAVPPEELLTEIDWPVA